MAGPRAWDSELAFCILILVLNGCADPVEKKVLYGQEYNRETIGFLDSPDATRDKRSPLWGRHSWKRATRV